MKFFSSLNPGRRKNKSGKNANLRLFSQHCFGFLRLPFSPSRGEIKISLGGSKTVLAFISHKFWALFLISRTETYIYTENWKFTWLGRNSARAHCWRSSCRWNTPADRNTQHCIRRKCILTFVTYLRMSFVWLNGEKVHAKVKEKVFYFAHLNFVLSMT